MKPTTEKSADIAVPETGDSYEPIHTGRFMDFEDFLDFGDAEERWEFIGGLPVVPRSKTIGTSRMQTHLNRLLHEQVEKAAASFDVWGYGAMVRIDDFNALLPSVLVEPRPEQRREWLICDPALVIEASFGCERDRAVLHERRAMYLSPGRMPPVAEYVAVIDSGPPDLHRDHRPLMNFRPFTGRTYTAASRARRVYRFRPGGQLDRFEGDEPVELTSIELTLPAEAFFLD